MGFIFGGPTAWKVKPCGEIVVAFHWVNKEPSLCIYPARKRPGSSVFVIPLGLAHAYANRHGYPPDGAIARCMVAAQVMAMEPSKDTVHNILTAILDNLEDLVRMPPEAPQRDKTPALGVATLYSGGSKIAESEITVGPEKLH